MSTPSLRIRHQTRYRPVGAGVFHILIQLTAPAVVTNGHSRPPLDLAFVVDRSGSMGGGAFELARRGVEHALRLLNERDSVSVVVYDNRIDTLLSQRRFDHDAHAKAVRRLGRIGPRGSTDLAGGWLTGCHQLARVADDPHSFRPDGGRSIVRTLLLTDGLANVGMTNPGEIATHAAELAARGISTSTFGVGYHYDEVLLAQMADAGRGHYYHVADTTMIPTVFANELGEMLEVAMRDAQLDIRLPDGWHPSLMNDLPFVRQDGLIRLPLGELASREIRSFLWELTLPASMDGQEDEIEIRVSWQDPRSGEHRESTVHHVVQTSWNPGRPDRDVQDELARFIAARARAEAVRYNRTGQYHLAQEVIQSAAAAMPDTDVGREVARELLHDVAPTLRQPANPADLKRHFAEARRIQHSRKDVSRS